MQELTIRYTTDGGHGKMLLNLENCFPCSKSWLKKVLQVVDMDPRSDELRAELVIYLNERLDEVADEAAAVEKKKQLAEMAVFYKEEAQKTEKKILAIAAQEHTCDSFLRKSVRDKEARKAYKAQLAEIRKLLRHEKEQQRFEIQKSRDAENALAKMIRDEKKLREDLEVLGAGR